MTALSARKLVLALLACIGMLGAFAEETFQGKTPAEWLGQMGNAFSQLNYDGVFSYYSGHELSTLRVVHALKDGIQRERLVHLNGALREIIRNGGEVSCILQPGDEILALQGSIPAGPFARAFTQGFENTTDVYSTRFNGMGRVAARNAVRLVISPKDENRFGYRLWLDEKSGLLLRSELLDEKGSKLEIFQFAVIKIGQPISGHDLAAETPSGSVVSHLTLESRDPLNVPVILKKMYWKAGWIPAGFAMDSWDIRRAPNSRKPVNTLMYSDGLAAFSVFIEDMPLLGAGNVESRDGATVVVTQIVRGPQKSEHLITVVGEVPTDTARRIASSVEYQKP